MYRPLTSDTSINVENVTEDYIQTDEGRIKITQECTFMIYHKNLRFGIEAHHIDDDHDMYSIRIFNQSAEKDRYRREDDNEICCAFLDSTGGGTMGEVISTDIVAVDNAIMDILFGNQRLGINPLIKPF